MYSRKASSKVTRGSICIACSVPLTRSVTLTVLGAGVGAVGIVGELLGIVCAPVFLAKFESAAAAVLAIIS
jgi:hypothetical protein